MKKALIIIDIQNDYFSGGTMELVDIDTTLQNTNKLIKYARLQEYKIYFIQHISLNHGATFFLPNTHGCELNDSLDRQGETIIKKNYPNSFRDTNLLDELKQNNLNELVICGAMTHMCVDSTVRAGFDLGYKITLANDACATKDLKFNDTTIKAQDIQNSFISALGGVFCETKSTTEIIKQ